MEGKAAARETSRVGSGATAKAVGISLRQLDYWVHVLHVVHPRLQSHGRRRFRAFSAPDLRMLNAVKRLLGAGYTLRAAVRASRTHDL